MLSLLLVCAALVAGVLCDDSVVKRHADRRNRLADRFTDQERLLNSIEGIVVDKFAELKAQQISLADQIADRDHALVAKFEDMSADHRSLTDKVTDSDRKIQTLQSQMSQLVESVNELKDRLARDSDCERRTTDNPPTTTTAEPTVPGACPVPGYVRNAHGCYRVVSEEGRRGAASTSCGRDGAHLLNLETEEELLAMNGIIDLWSYYWIGGKRINGEWRWESTNTRFNFTNWMYREPDGYGDCVAMFYRNPTYPDLRWNDYDCDDNTFPYYICELP